MTLAIIGSPTRTNIELADAWRRAGIEACVLWPHEALRTLGPEDLAVTRLDVLPTLDGIEPGLEFVTELEVRGVRVWNHPSALLAAHDKLLTRDRLEDAGLPHPRTVHVVPGSGIPHVPLPFVLKPRFGSWGQHVHLCLTSDDVPACFERIAGCAWWHKHGGLAQELVGVGGADLRVIVAGRRAVAAARRIAAPGEWRTNVTLGGRIVRAELPAAAGELATKAARAIGMDFVGVDLLAVDGSWTVLELNGAVDFDDRYALPGIDPPLAILEALGVVTHAEALAAGTYPAATNGKETTMARTVQGKPAMAGDEIVITGHSVGDAPRTALILEVLGEEGHERFHVRWEDGHESIFFPGDDAIIHRPERKRARSPAS